MTEVKQKAKPAPRDAVAQVNPDVIAVVAAILSTKGVPTAAAIEQAKFILEKSHELA